MKYTLLMIMLQFHWLVSCLRIFKLYLPFNTNDINGQTVYYSKSPGLLDICHNLIHPPDHDVLQMMGTVSL